MNKKLGPPTLAELAVRPAKDRGREAFEDWARGEGYNVARGDGFTYDYSDTKDAWRGWKAGTRNANG